MKSVIVKLAPILPFVLPVMFYQVYRPFNHAWVYDYFGGTSRDLNGPWRFTANDFNLTLWILIYFLDGIFWIWLCEENIHRYLKFVGLLVIFGICNYGFVFAINYN
tara:strand:- start:7286 stop:7603 length:318 start_codon:yes stop_codon:yes gene_type:complete